MESDLVDGVLEGADAPAHVLRDDPVQGTEEDYVAELLCGEVEDAVDLVLTS